MLPFIVGVLTGAALIGYFWAMHEYGPRPLP